LPDHIALCGFVRRCRHQSRRTPRYRRAQEGCKNRISLIRVCELWGPPNH
jgi:hypothetical protein